MMPTPTCATPRRGAKDNESVVVMQGSNNKKDDLILDNKRQRSLRETYETALLNDYGALVLVCICLYLHFFVSRPQRIMDTYLLEHNLMNFMLSMRNTTTTRPESRHAPVNSMPRKLDKYLVFNGDMGGQGNGNIVNGLLASHLLGEEFNRTVCITNYKSFNLAFQSKFPHNCESIGAVLPKKNTNNSISIVNYSVRPNECQIVDKLSSDQHVIYVFGNTYPKWPAIPDQFFHRYYEPTDMLKQTIPWSNPPRVVVHLRQGDNERSDRRPGLDNETLDTLGKTLPRNTTYLVTNRVEWYQQMQDSFGWQHPSWTKVRHSAMNRYIWDDDSSSNDKQPSLLTFRGPDNKQSLSDSDLQDLQLWSDWFTILSAQQVYHTHSDFSLSAIHWMGTFSKTILGTNHSQLLLREEPWQREGNYKRLVDRAREELYCETPTRAPRKGKSRFRNPLVKNLEHATELVNRQEGLFL